LIFSFMAYGQEESRAVKKRKDQLEKQEETKIKKAEVARQKSIKQHEKIQGKETQKRMKKNKKKSKRLNNNQREFFLVRWFS
jgi:hypothetical protein